MTTRNTQETPKAADNTTTAPNWSWPPGETLPELGELLFGAIVTGRIGTLHRIRGGHISSASPLEQEGDALPYALLRREAAMRLLALRTAAIDRPELAGVTTMEPDFFEGGGEPDDNPDLVQEAMRSPEALADPTAPLEDAMDAELLAALKEAALVLLASRPALAAAWDDLRADGGRLVRQPQALRPAVAALVPDSAERDPERRWNMAVEQARQLVRETHDLPPQPASPHDLSSEQEKRTAWRMLQVLGLNPQQAEDVRRRGVQRRRIVEADPDMREQLNTDSELFIFMDNILLGLMPPWDGSGDTATEARRLVEDMRLHRRDLFSRLTANWTPSSPALRSNATH
ncbi:MAG: hypothetical protein LLP51_10290 [Halorhodospira halophila]|uniref:hypothetical protein n=1 Tax=Halorhodospira halophila TaxID=1053 RepID=UPI0026EBF457|nr:hypothetical protein [Halorhodospira halophila]MCC3751770.1 hypothetical protein [Halorhodospira halophila]